jgi:DNA-binding PadR family transcriptional regulator
VTELEGCVIGVVWLRGPCTAYVVRQEFLRSESSHWSGSAGAIYPLLQRMEQQKLIRSRSQRWGKGRKKQFEITDAGLAALHRWIGPPLAQWTAQPTFDPIRTRFTFLGTLSAAKRRQFLAEARKNVQNEVRRTRTILSAIDRERLPFEYLVALAVLHELEARARWLREAARWI